MRLNAATDNAKRVVLEIFLAAFNSAGFMARPAWSLMHYLPMYSGCPRMDLSVAESLELRIVNLPSSVSLVGSV